MKPADHLVLVLDDDAAMLASLQRLLTKHGYKVRLHQEPEELFCEGPPVGPACLLLDNHLGNGNSGIKVHAELLRRGWNVPTIFLTGQWNIKEVVDAIRGGADAFLTKPYDPGELTASVAEALDRSMKLQGNHNLVSEAKARAATLTSREREVVCLVVAGKLNKEVADELGIALITAKVHRGRAMKKLGAGNPAELARIANLAGLCA